MTENTQPRNDTEQAIQQSQTNATPAETGGEKGKAGRMFSQDEVNQIVSDRLSRERAKASGESAPDISEREKDLTARENGLKCKEFISENSSRYPKELLELFDTSDFDSFKEKAEKLLELFPSIACDSPKFVYSKGTPGPLRTSQKDMIREVFLGKS